MKASSWTCRYCQQPTTVGEHDIHLFVEHFSVKGSDGRGRAMTGSVIRCPNPECYELSVKVVLAIPHLIGGDWRYDEEEHSWTLLPRSGAKAFPDYIPAAIRQDYEEAYSILEGAA